MSLLWFWFTKPLLTLVPNFLKALKMLNPTPTRYSVSRLVMKHGKSRDLIVRFDSLSF